jgi:HSP20 family protein
MPLGSRDGVGIDLNRSRFHSEQVCNGIGGPVEGSLQLRRVFRALSKLLALRRTTMSAAPRSMFRELKTLRERIERLISDVRLSLETGLDEGIAPPVDLQEVEDEFVAKASMPGIKPDDVHIKVASDILTIRGESREERDEKKCKWYLGERRFGSMYRSLTLPSPVNEDQTQAKMHDGVLEIRLPKAEEVIGKQIKVTSS